MTVREPIPTSITSAATSRPATFAGTWSSYPTVVTVCTAHQSPDPSTESSRGRRPSSVIPPRPLSRSNRGDHDSRPARGSSAGQPPVDPLFELRLFVHHGRVRGRRSPSCGKTHRPSDVHPVGVKPRPAHSCLNESECLRWLAYSGVTCAPRGAALWPEAFADRCPEPPLAAGSGGKSERLTDSEWDGTEAQSAPGVLHSTEPGWNDRNLRELPQATSISGVVFAHVPPAPGSPVPADKLSPVPPRSVAVDAQRPNPRLS